MAAAAAAAAAAACGPAKCCQGSHPCPAALMLAVHVPTPSCISICCPCSTAEDGEAGLGGGGSPGAEPPHLALLGSEAWTWEGVANLDQFFTRIYRCCKNG